MALHRELARYVIQLLTDVFTHALELAAAAALGVLRFVVDQGAGQFRRQWRALWLFLRWGR
jgi:hypothetical protein